MKLEHRRYRAEEVLFLPYPDETTKPPSNTPMAIIDTNTNTMTPATASKMVRSRRALETEAAVEIE